MSERIIDCSGPINVGFIVAEVNNKLDLRTGGSIAGNIIIQDSSLRVENGSAYVELVDGSVELNDGTNSGLFELNPSFGSLDIIVNDSTALSLSGSLAPSTNFAPSDDAHLTRKDYVDDQLSKKVSSNQEESVGSLIDNMIALTQTEYDNLSTKNPTTYYVIIPSS